MANYYSKELICPKTCDQVAPVLMKVNPTTSILFEETEYVPFAHFIVFEAPSI